MDESRGTLKTALLLRVAYMESRDGLQFCTYCQRVFEMDEFTAELIWEVIDAVADLGVTPDENHPIMKR